MLVYSGDVITFYNNTVGCITKSGKIAVVGKSGVAASRYPDFFDYAARNTIKTVEHSAAYDGPYTKFFDNEDPRYVEVDHFDLELGVERPETSPMAMAA